jgi:hypothetical protein
LVDRRLATAEPGTGEGVLVALIFEGGPRTESAPSAEVRPASYPHMGTDPKYYKFYALASELLSEVEDERRLYRLAPLRLADDLAHALEYPLWVDAVDKVGSMSGLGPPRCCEAEAR